MARGAIHDPADAVENFGKVGHDGLQVRLLLSGCRHWRNHCRQLVDAGGRVTIVKHDVALLCTEQAAGDSQGRGA